MGRASAEDLAELLSELKQRSGRSYEALGRRTGLSRSTVHRYCRGEIVPDTYGTVERIAKACGASKAELDELYGRWAHAIASLEHGGTGTPTFTLARHAAEPDEVGSAEKALDRRVTGRDPLDRETAGRAPEPSASGVIPWRSRYVDVRQGVTFLGMGLVILCASVLTASTSPARQPVRQTPQWVNGPSWTLPEAPVPRTLFGVTLNSATGAMPTFRVGAVRLWDSGTRWAEIQPERGAFDWSVLDRQIDGAEKAGLPVLFVMGGTPAWASPAGPLGPYPDGSRAAPPDNLNDWDAFVRAVAKRYRGRVQAYELWVLANDRRFYAGTMESLVEMTRRASRIIRAADPEATLVCPGMGQLWTDEGRRTLQRFAALGGYGYCDVAGIKLHQRTPSDPPESMLELVTTVDRTFHQAGIHPRLWNTGTTYSIPLQGSLDETRARNHAVRFFLTGLYARDFNLERMYFYNWGGTKIPIVLQAVGGVPTRAALAVEQLQRWLVHAESRSCGHGTAVNLPENVWQCEVVVAKPGDHHEATIRWTIGGTAETTAGPRVRAVRRLDGTTEAVRPGDVITVTEEPILIESRS
ncbi:helix-turn-helix domain-containing protein [Rhizohabitans arisaemae]|uniref:helix-turn-helix domain-containing protein n=1 Tax=Rhizohabitans arisaemae TaxID=2720610 RepID=UPI0024B1D5EF|nr:helix-turn-helix domain-containing protein [Rhizohabitans arisaemae]